MKEVTKTIYKCDHCAKWYQRKHFAEKHEERCSKNPDNFRACFGCSLLKPVEVDYYQDSPMGGEYCTKISAFYCEKVDTYLHPPITEHKGNALDFGDKLNEPMKKRCSQRIDENETVNFF